MTSPSESPVYSFLQRPSMVDFPGKLALVVFVSGCNFKCGFCHNAPLMGKKQEGITWDRLKEVCRTCCKDWVDGVVISGGEPTLLYELPDLMDFFRGYGWSIKLDTNGSQPQVVKRIKGEVDYVAMDVKAGASGYPELVGWDDLGAIRESIAIIREGFPGYEFRTTIIESFHTDDQMREIGEMIRGCDKYVLQPFLPREDLPDPRYRTMARTSPDRMVEIRDLMREYTASVEIRGEV